MQQSIAEKIQQRRLQVLVHSYLYYELDTNLVPDNVFDRWSHELVDLQSKYPEVADTVIYADAFRDWGGSTGMDLPYSDLDIVSRANYLLNLVGKKSENLQKNRAKSEKPKEQKKTASRKLF